MADVMGDDRLLKMKDEDGVVSPFEGIEKGSVLQDCRCFNDLQLDTQKCEAVLVRLLYLVGQGEKLSSAEATDVFFSVTKLFQANAPSLRRLVYLAIKELAHTAEEVIIVTNCLTKDINSNVDMYRANATRVLCKITDAQMVQAIERYLKQEIVDRNPVVASAALVSGQQLLANNKGDVVRRWVNEITQALEHQSPMVQFHALALLYQIKQHDRLAVAKLVTAMTRGGGSRSPLATVLLVRYAARMMSEDTSTPPGGRRPLFDFLESCLRHRSDIVKYEAVRAIAALPDVTANELMPAVTVLRLMLTQPQAAMRYAAMRTLASIAFTAPIVVAACNSDMEILIGDGNRSIATLAVTTLMRTGSESSLEGLLKQIGGFLADLADELKVRVVEALREVCLKYPSKHHALLNFLGNALREEGGLEFKRSIVSAYLDLMATLPGAKEMCLGHLCEFIEDCEHSQLSTQILHLLGREGPHTSAPEKYIRYIYNRLILERPPVRAAAVSALARFAGSSSTPALRRSVAVLLQQSLADSDDEVRDRAAYLYKALGLDQFKIARPGVGGVIKLVSPSANGASTDVQDTQNVAAMTAKAEAFSLPCPVANLEAELLRYISTGDTSTTFSVDVVPKQNIMQSAEPPGSSGPGGPVSTGARPGAAAAGGRRAEPKLVDPAAAVMAVPQLAELGRPFKSSASVALTEEEVEYTVNVTKHLYPSHVVLQFDVENTLEDNQLENVTVAVDTSGASGLADVVLLPAAVAKLGSPATAFTIITRTDGELPLGAMACTLRYTVHDVDAATGEVDESGYEDDYQLEDLELTIGDLMVAPAEPPANFRAAWEALGGDNEVAEEFSLSHDSVATAVGEIIGYLSMAPCGGSGDANPRARSHVLLMAGIFAPKYEVLLRAQVTMQADGVALHVVVRSQDFEVSQVIAGSIA